MIVDPPLASAKPGEKFPALTIEKLTTPKKNSEAKKYVPSALKLIKPLASMPPSSSVKPVAEENAASSMPAGVAPHSYDRIFIME